MNKKLPHKKGGAPVQITGASIMKKTYKHRNSLFSLSDYMIKSKDVQQMFFK